MNAGEVAGSAGRNCSLKSLSFTLAGQLFPDVSSLWIKLCSRPELLLEVPWILLASIPPFVLSVPSSPPPTLPLLSYQSLPIPINI